MLVVFTKRNCHSSYKAKRWLEDHQILFVEKRLQTNKMTKSEFFQILQLTENGTTDIISPYSNKYKEIGQLLEEICLSDLWILVSKYPSLLRSPIMYTEKQLLIGFNDYEIRSLIPRSERKVEQCINLFETP